MRQPVFLQNIRNKISRSAFLAVFLNSDQFLTNFLESVAVRPYVLAFFTYGKQINGEIRAGCPEFIESLF
jgi:hypothetical protein